MKPVRILIITALVMLVTKVQAQYPSVTFFGGVNGASMSVKLGSTSTAMEDSYKMLLGINAGALYDHVLKKNRNEEFTVESGLIFENKGYNQDVSNDGLNIDNITTLYYLDIPVYLKYRYRFRNRNKIYFGAGPFVGYGLFGNTQYTYSYEGTDPITNNESIDWGNDEAQDDYKRLDYGVTGKIGFLMDNGLNLSLSYDYGIPNIVTLDEIREEKTRIVRLSIGYTLKLND